MNKWYKKQIFIRYSFEFKIKPGDGIHKITVDGCQENYKYCFIVVAIPKGLSYF